MRLSTAYDQEEAKDYDNWLLSISNGKEGEIIKLPENRTEYIRMTPLAKPLNGVLTISRIENFETFIKCIIFVVTQQLGV